MSSTTGHRRTGEVESPARQVGDHLHDAFRVPFGLVGQRPAERADFDRRVSQHGCDRGVDAVRIEQRLVALDVDHQATGQLGDDLGNAVGAAGMVGPRHDRNAADGLNSTRNALVIGRDERRVYLGGSGRPSVDVRNHRLAREVGENFSGEPRRVEPRGDNGEDRRLSQRIPKTLDRIGAHGESYHSRLWLSGLVASSFLSAVASAKAVSRTEATGVSRIWSNREAT